MADPLSIGAGVVGIVAPALHVTRILLNDLKAIKDAPQNIKALTANISSLDMALTSVKSLQESEWKSLGPAVANSAKSTIASSTAACERFDADVHKWTRRSKDGSLSVLDRALVGFFRKTHLTSMNGEIQICHTKLTSVVTIATLMKSIQQGQITEEIKKLIASHQEELKNASQAAATNSSALEKKLEFLNADGDPDDVEYQDAVKQLEEEHKALEVSQRLLTELFSSLQESTRKATGVTDNSVHTTFGAYNSGVQSSVNHGTINFTPK